MSEIFRVLQYFEIYKLLCQSLWRKRFIDFLLLNYMIKYLSFGISYLYVKTVCPQKLHQSHLFPPLFFFLHCQRWLVHWITEHPRKLRTAMQMGTQVHQERGVNGSEGTEPLARGQRSLYTIKMHLFHLSKEWVHEKTQKRRDCFHYGFFLLRPELPRRSHVSSLKFWKFLFNLSVIIRCLFQNQGTLLHKERF